MEPVVPFPQKTLVKNELGRTFLFRELDEPELDELAGLFTELEAEAEELIIDAREGAEAFFVVRSGRVVVFRDLVGEPVQLLARLERGDFFGELGIFDHAKHSVSVRSSEAATLLRAERGDLLRFLTERPNIRLKLQMAALQRHGARIAAALELGRRREVRMSLHRRVTLEPEGGPPAEVVLSNLSIGGLSLEPAPESWREGVEVRFTLHLPQGVLELAGQIAWRRSEAVGVAFIQTHPQHDLVIQMAIRTLLS